MILDYVKRFDTFDLQDFMDMIEVVLMKDPPARLTNLTPNVEDVIDSVASGEVFVVRRTLLTVNTSNYQRTLVLYSTI